MNFPTVNVAMEEDDDNYAKLDGLVDIGSEGDDSVFGDESSGDENCYSKVIRPPDPPVRIQSIKRYLESTFYIFVTIS